MAISGNQEYVDVQEIIREFFESTSDQALRKLQELMVEKLDFSTINQTISMAGAPATVELPGEATAIARFQGVTAIYLPLASRRVRKRDVDGALKIVGGHITGELLIVASNLSQSPDGPNQLHFIFPSESGSRTTLRRIVIERGLPIRTAVQQLVRVYENVSSGKSITESLEDAFSVERVTREFFRDYREVFEQIERKTAGFSRYEAEDRRLFVQTLMNRLMFIQFLARKGWMKFNDDADYLNALWADYQRVRKEEPETEQKNFLQQRLNPLFTTALNNPSCRDLLRNNPTLKALVGDVHFLNGGLFDDLDGFDDQVSNGGIAVDDSGIELILRNRPGNHGLFNRYNFTVLESTPWDVEVAVDPEMLGKVFEELVTGRHESGSYYTPRPVVSFMCREALKGYLNGENTGASAEAIRKFVDQHDHSDIGLDARPAVSAALRRVTVVDPACGSGAYLLGMLRELVDLQQVLLGDVEGDSPDEVYGLKLHVIENNLYGADIDLFAVNIAMLRLWLSLSVDYEGVEPRPLPNLDFKITYGDSLTAPAPVLGEQLGLLRHRIEQLATDAAALKLRHVNSVGIEKSALREQIESIEQELESAHSDDPSPSGSVDWRIEFAEIFSQGGGFDIVIANPPYVRKEEIPAEIKPILRANFSNAITGRSDLYCSFYARGMQLLTDNGIHVYVCSNAWLDAGYGAQLQDFLLKTGHIQAIYDSSVERQFSTADVNTIVSIIEKKRAENSDITRFVLFTEPFEKALADRSGVIETRIEQHELGTQGTQGGTYVGNKWGGKYLRAPSIYKHIFGELSDRFIELGKLAGISGYIHDNNAGDDNWPMQPVIWSLRDASTIEINKESPGVRVVGVRPVGNSSDHAPILFPRTFGARHLILSAGPNVLGKEFYKVHPHGSDSIESILLQLNSTLGIIQREVLGIKSLGGGALKFAAADVGQFQILVGLDYEDIASTWSEMKSRRILDIEDELDQMDRRAVDRLMFEHLDLSLEQQGKVYEAARWMVNARATKSRTVAS